MCDNFKCLSSQVGMDAGLFHPCFFGEDENGIKHANFKILKKMVLFITSYTFETY